MIRAVIFDLNGVFIVSRRLSDRFNEDFGVPKDEFMLTLNEVMSKVRLPNAGDAYEHWKPHLNEWGVDLNSEEFYDYWFNAESINTELIDVAKDFKSKGLKLIILSNNLRERTEYYYKKFPRLFAMFDQAYFSWQTGFIKPDKRGFDLLLQESNLRPEECIYFDDRRENIVLAKSLGFEAHLYDGVSGVAATINKLL